MKNKKLKVLLACDYLGPNPGNFIPSILELENYIHIYGGATVYAFSDKCREFGWCKEMAAAGKKIYFYESKALRYGVRFLNDIIKKENVNVIHTHFEPFDKPTLLIKLMHPSVKIVWHLHDDFTLGIVQKPTLLQRVKMFARDHLVDTIAVSPHIKTKNGYVLINHLATKYLPSGTKFDIDRQELRKNLGIAKNDFAIFFFGWDKIRKGLDIACEMLSFLTEEERNHCKLCIQVTKNEKNEEFVREYCAYPEKIIWMKSTPDVYNYHMAADVMLSAARSETFAYTIMEALAVGTAVVSSDIPGVQWSKEYSNIWYFESGNAKACANAIEKCMSEFNEDCAVETAQKIRESLPISEWCRQIYEIYTKD